MSIGTADLHKAIATAWTTHGGPLDWQFKRLWAEAKRARFVSLNDTEAAPKHPFPYCVYEASDGVVVSRMSGPGKTKRQVRNLPVEFRIYAKKRADDARSAKEIAADLAALVMEVYGGHPTETRKAATMALDNGNHLQTEFLTDYGLRLGDDEHVWIISYNFLVDVPVLV